MTVSFQHELRFAYKKAYKQLIVFIVFRFPIRITRGMIMLRCRKLHESHTTIEMRFPLRININTSVAQFLDALVHLVSNITDTLSVVVYH